MAIPVRTLLQIILENELKLDDEIAFDLADYGEINGEYYEINLCETAVHTIQGIPKKTFTFVFSLDREGEENKVIPTKEYILALFDEMQEALKKIRGEELK